MPFRDLSTDAFTPEALNDLYTAFDLAWADIAAEYGNDPTRIEFARRALALAILAAYKGGSHDPQSVREAALAAFAAMRPRC